MKSISGSFVLLGIAAAGVCRAATINVTTSGVTTEFSLVYNSTVAGSFPVSSTSPPGNLVARLDDIADTASFVNAELGVVTSAYNRTFQRTITTVIPPTGFPDPPIIITTPLTETITIDPINLPVQFVSSSTAPIGYLPFLLLYGFSSSVNISFPSSFTVTGTYQVQGPTESITTPFSIPFQPTHGGNVNGRWNGFIQVGNNYPDTARMGAIDILPFLYPAYTSGATTIFQGTVDGVAVTARFNRANTHVMLPMPIPEPIGVIQWSVGLALLAMPTVRRCGRAIRWHT